MKPHTTWSLWLSLILGTAVAVCCFIGLVYLLAEVF
jgi:hypothetical protein